ETLDQAALDAGRGPESIRRLYNVFGTFGSASGFLQGTPDNWAEQLAELAVTTGMSSFILGTDSPDAVRRFAEEVAPAVRERVTEERAGSVAQAVPATGHGAPVAPTPDDGTRLTGELAWNEPTRPTYG